MALLLVYILLCLFIGLIGQDKRFGFWGYFFASVILTPLGGLLLLVPSDKPNREE